MPQIIKPDRRNAFGRKIYEQRYLWLFFVLPGLIWYIIFAYIPIGGIIIAFQDYKVVTGFWNSPWVGLKHFENFVNSYYFWPIIRNTLSISAIKLVFGFPVPIMFALLIYEINNMFFRRITQTISYLPHFLSWVVTIGIIGKLLSVDGGVVNELLIMLGIEPHHFLYEPSAIWPIAYFSDIWKEMGWGAIIYLAALSSINTELYEAAKMDGAGRIRRMWHISLPGIRSTVMILLILAVGNIFNSNFDQLYLLGTPPVLDYAEVIDTFIYRETLQSFQYSLGTAIGIMKMIIGLVLVISLNQISRRLTGDSLW